MATVFATLLSIPLGVIAALKQDTWVDYAVRIFSIAGLAMPSFWLGILMILCFLIFFHWVPPMIYTPFWVDPWQNMLQLLLYGPPGSGKTAFAHHLAQTVDRPLVLKRASDILSPWLGETEKNLARMFRDAASDEAVLLLDEADSFLQDRQNAVRSWEVTQVNELLTQMECFPGLFLCATNFRQNVDSAALRRFGLKVEFDYLNLDQRNRLYLATLAELGCERLDELALARSDLELARLNNLTPGDFAAVKQRMEMLDKAVTAVDLIAALTEESKLKPDGGRRSIGFAA